MEQDAVLRKEKLKSLEIKAEIARLNHQPMNHQLARSQSVPNTPTHRPAHGKASQMTKTSAKDPSSIRGETSISPQEVYCMAGLFSSSI